MSEQRRFSGAIDVFDLNIKDDAVAAGTSIAFDILSPNETNQGLARDTIEEYTNLDSDRARRVIGAVVTSLSEVRLLAPQDFVDGPPPAPSPQQPAQLAAFEAVQQGVAPVVLHAELQNIYGLDGETSADIAAQAAQDQADLDSLTYAQNE